MSGPATKSLRVMFVLTSMPVGGAETLLANLVRRLDRRQFQPEICCLKTPGPLGEELACELPVHAGLLAHKWDLRVFHRLCRLYRSRHIDAVVTVGAGDKMFWGRLAAGWCGIPVVCSAIHSTGWPDSIGFLNRHLSWLTDAYIAVAAPHARYLVAREGFPPRKVRLIPNGVDTDRFHPRPNSRLAIRQELGIPAEGTVIGVVAALRPEKNLPLFLRAAATT
ncbi:MAG: glycosyltransferase, partial [Pirellulaceae bacterium]